MARASPAHRVSPCFSIPTRPLVVRSIAVTTTTAYGSSLTILAGSFASNQTYELMVQMESRQNSTDRFRGYLLVRVDDTQPQRITIG